MRYWINRRARELSLRFMYSIDIDDQDSLDAIKIKNLLIWLIIFLEVID